jgi:hypothetical protein
MMGMTVVKYTTFCYSRTVYLEVLKFSTGYSLALLLNVSYRGGKYLGIGLDKVMDSGLSRVWRRRKRIAGRSSVCGLSFKGCIMAGIWL